MLRLRGMRNSQESAQSTPILKNDENDENVVPGDNRSNRLKNRRPPLRTLIAPTTAKNDRNTLKSKKRPLEENNKKSVSLKRRDYKSLSDEEEQPQFHKQPQEYHPKSLGITYLNARHKSSPVKGTAATSTVTVPVGNRHSRPFHDGSLSKSIPISTLASDELSLDGNDMMPSLFSTGRGQSLRVSVAKVMAYQAVLASVESEGPDERSMGPAVSVIASSSLSAEDPIVCAPSVVVSMFQTGRGSQVKISDAKVREYAAKFEDNQDNNPLTRSHMTRTGGGDDSISRQSTSLALHLDEQSHDHLVSKQSAAKQTSSANAVVSLFQSGNGRAIHVSADKAMAYAQSLFASHDDDTTAVTSIPPSMSCTSTVQHVTHRKWSCRDRAILRPHDDQTVATGSTGENTCQALVESVFQSGTGRPLKISLEKAKAYEHQLFANPHDEDVAQKATGTPNAANAEIKLQRNANEGQAETLDVHGSRDGDNLRQIWSTSTPDFASRAGQRGASNELVVSLFTSGKGQPLKVARDKAISYERSLFEDNDESREPIKKPAMPLPLAVSASAASTGPVKQHLSSENQDIANVDKSAASSLTAMATTQPRIQRKQSIEQLSIVTSLFTSGRGGQPHTISAEKFQVYDRTLFADTSSDVCQEKQDSIPSQATSEQVHQRNVLVINSDVVPDTPSLQVPAQSFGGRMLMTSMFQTGSGRHVAVSVDQVEKYQRQQDLDEDGRSATDKVDATMAKALTDVVTTNSSFVEEAVKCRDVDGRSEKRDGNNEATSSDKNIALTCDGSAKGSSQAIKPTAVACVLESGRCQGVNVSQVPVSTLDGAVDSRKNVNDQNTAAHTPQVTPTTSAGPILCQIHQPAESSEALVSIDTASTKLDNSSTVPRSTAHGKRHPQSVVGTRRPKPFKPPQKLIKSPPCVVPAVESCLPPKAPVPVVAVPFSVSLSERWDFSSLAASPTAFNPYPFESVITNICATNAHLVHFNHVGRPEFVREQGDGMTLSAAELYQYMVSQRHILPALGASFAWFVNHFRWIVLKCAAMERTFVAHLFGKYCTQAQLAFQLSRRFHRELEKAERPALMKIYQRDAHPGNAIVLFVAAVYATHIVLSDGWYGIVAVPSGKQFAAKFSRNLCGTKLVVWNATLINNSEGIHPLEARVNQVSDDEHFFDQFDKNKDPYLALHINSTRRVRWSTKLGVERPHFDGPCLLQSLPLRSLKQDGGVVRSIRCVVLRASELLVLQSKEITHGPRVVPDKVMQNIMSSDFTSGPSTDTTITSAANAPVPFMRLRVACSHGAWSAPPANAPPVITTAVLTLWRPSEDMQTSCNEGSEIFVTSVAVSWKQTELYLSSSKHTTVRRAIDGAQTAQDYVGYKPRKALTGQDIQHMCGQDVDICVYIMEVTNEYAMATDRTWTVMCVKLPRWGAKAWKPKAVLCLRNVFVSHYDPRLDVVDCAMTDMSTFLTSPSATCYFAAPFALLKDTMQQQPTRLGQLHSRVRSTILNDPSTVEQDRAPRSQFATPTLDERTSQTNDAHCITGHPMHIFSLPEPVNDNVQGPLAALLYLDSGAQVYEIFVPAPLMTQAAHHVASHDLVCVHLRVGGIDDETVNSCRSWEAMETSKVRRVVATNIAVVAVPTEIEALLQRLA